MRDVLVWQLPQWVVSGVVMGCIYALVAVGLVIVHNVTRILNVAQGAFVMLGAMLTIQFAKWLPLAVAVVAAVVATVAVAAVSYGILIYPRYEAGLLTLIMLTFGADVIFRTIALIVWGPDPLRLREFTPGKPLLLGTAVITRQALWVIGVTALVVLLLQIFFKRSLIGTALRACASNPAAARLVGIRPQLMGLVSWILAAGLGALAGAVIAPVTFATYFMGLELTIRGVVPAVLAGLASPVGAIVGGISFGVIEAVAAGLYSGLRDVVAFVCLVAILLVREMQTGMVSNYLRSRIRRWKVALGARG
ncbi:MAG: branched-chain amino acid ABC transporter permease, partial [Thermomicrobium sp.]|nr:branched-chain amino acid ABC transporter permease [Thermomicrobium sp.]